MVCNAFVTVLRKRMGLIKYCGFAVQTIRFCRFVWIPAWYALKSDNVHTIIVIKKTTCFDVESGIRYSFTTQNVGMLR